MSIFVRREKLRMLMFIGLLFLITMYICVEPSFSKPVKVELIEKYADL